MPATSISDNVTVGPFTEIGNSVIGNDVEIGPGCIISDSVIGKGCVLKGRFTAIGGTSDVRIGGECASIKWAQSWVKIAAWKARDRAGQPLPATVPGADDEADRGILPDKVWCTKK
jgi:hypothetical protein